MLPFELGYIQFSRKLFVANYADIMKQNNNKKVDIMKNYQLLGEATKHNV